MPITYALSTFGLALATTLSLVVWVALEHRGLMAIAVRKGHRAFRSLFTKADLSLPRTADEITDVPAWWYGASLLLGTFLSIFCIEYWGIQLRWYGVLFSLLISGFFYFPVSHTIHPGFAVRRC